MSERNGYAPGVPCWVDTWQADAGAAAGFYGELFGWETDTFGEGEGAVTMWRVPGYVGGEPEQPVSRDVVAGMAALPPGAERPHWRVDFWVDDVDATVAKAIELGGRTLVPAFDSEIFRQAVIADPAGASFSVSRVDAGG